MEEFVGFGSGVAGGGCNIVVQLMTEEKRADVDLERLWEGVLVKAEKARTRLVGEEVALVRKSLQAATMLNVHKSRHTHLPPSDSILPLECRTKTLLSSCEHTTQHHAACW